MLAAGDLIVAVALDRAEAAVAEIGSTMPAWSASPPSQLKTAMSPARGRPGSSHWPVSCSQPASVGT
jgi:hypothetical protein